MCDMQRECDVPCAACDVQEHGVRNIARRPWHAAQHVARRTQHIALSLHVARGTWHVAAAASLCFLLSAGSSSAAPIIDRVMAVVSGSIITLSDVEAAMAVGIVNVPNGPDPIGPALDELIDRTLMLIEVDRYAPPEPRPERLESRLRELLAHLDTSDPERQLSKYGLSNEALRGFARDDLRLRVYLNQRFAAGDPVTDEDVERYYGEHQGEFSREGVVQPLADVRQEVIQRVVATRRAQMIADWVKGLRSRADVTILYLPQSEVQSSMSD